MVLTPNAVVLLDGATAAPGDTLSGGWYARRLAERIGTELSADPSGELDALLGTAIAGVAAEHRLRPRSAPSSTVAMLRWTGDRVDALVLADSPVVVFTGAGTDVLADTRLADLRRAGLLRTRAAVDALRNTRDGFWVAEADPAAAGQALRRSWRRADVAAVVLATDGVSVGVDQYRVLDWPGVLDLGLATGADAVLDVVRTAERADPSAARWPRPKRHDDQALAVLDFTRDAADLRDDP